MKIKPCSSTPVICFFCCLGLQAQYSVCADPSTLFGMSNSGLIYPINSSDGSVGLLLNTANYNYTSSYSPAVSPLAANSPAAGNGIGYNNVNGKFYYFKRSPSQGTPQFVSYDPVTNKYSILAKPNSGVNTNTGCVNFNGLGYYTVNVQGQLWYYDITLDTWTLITSKMTDQGGANISSYVQSHGSGDIAIDGLGNLWIMPSSSNEYGLFKLPAPLPTTSRASIMVQTMVQGNTPTPTGFSLWGIAFDPLGAIYMSTGDDQLYKITSVESPAAYVGTFNGPITGLGADLTSCAFPMTVLPVNFTAFTAVQKHTGTVLLNWTIAGPEGNSGFSIEHSTDGIHWRAIGHVAVNAPGNGRSYHFTDAAPAAPVSYYRVRMTNADGTGIYSAVKPVSLKTSGRVLLWPNPVSGVLNVQAGGNGSATVFDLAGRALQSNPIKAGVTPISLSALPAGTYLLRVQLESGEQANERFIKQ